MAQYVDGYVIPIKKKNAKAYIKMAKLGCKIWMEHGALSYYECLGDDLKNPWGQPFTKLCKLKSDETAVFAFVVYKSKAHRKQVNTKVHSDPRMQKQMELSQGAMPFDMNRFSVGGFKVAVKSSK